MNVILSMADYENMGLLSKDFQVLYNQPLIKYILDELYSYQEYIDDIVIVTSKINYFSNILKFIIHDDLFLDRIHLVEDTENTLLSNLLVGTHYFNEYSLNKDSVLFWSCSELAFNTRKFSDINLKSFKCIFIENKEKSEDISDNLKIVYDSETNTFKLLELGDIHINKDLVIKDNTIEEFNNVSVDDSILGETNHNKLGNFTVSDIIQTYNGKYVNIFKFKTSLLSEIVNTSIPEKDGLIFNELIEDYFLKDEESSIVYDIGFLFTLTNTYSESQFKQYIQLKNSLDNNDIVIDINFYDDTIIKTNKYSLLKYSRDNQEKSRLVQKRLFNESDILGRYNSKQRIYSPELIEQGITKRGDYVDTITEEFIPGITLDKIMLFGNNSDEKINYLISKIVNTIKNVYHSSDCDPFDINVQRFDDKKINSFLETEKQYYISVLDYYKEKYSISCISKNSFVFDGNEYNLWKLFIDKVFLVYSQIITDNIIYQGSCDRFIHGNLLLSSIILNQEHSKIYFTNQNYRYYKSCDLNNDFVDLFVSLYMNIHAFENHLFKWNEGSIEIYNEALNKTKVYLDSFEKLIENSSHLKLLSILKMLSYPYRENTAPEISNAIITYCRQIRNAVFQIGE